MSKPEEPDVSAAAQAKAAMDRARAAARTRGSQHQPGGQKTRARTPQPSTGGGGETDALPYGIGRDPHAVGGEISRMFERLGWTEQVEVASVAARWREVVGDEIADHCDVVSFDQGVLQVKASSTAWADQLKIISGQIRHRLNEELGRDVVTTVSVGGPQSRSWVKGPRSVKGRGPRDTYG